MNARPILALTLAALLPGVLFADSLTFRNDSPLALVVQTATLVRGTMKRDQPNLLRPGVTSPKLGLDSDKIITVYDGRSSRVLFQGMQRYSLVPVSYSIQPDPRSQGKMRLVPITRRPGG